MYLVRDRTKKLDKEQKDTRNDKEKYMYMCSPPLPFKKEKKKKGKLKKGNCRPSSTFATAIEHRNTVFEFPDIM